MAKKATTPAAAPKAPKVEQAINLAAVIRDALKALGPADAKAKDVADWLSKKFPDSATIATKTADKQWGSFVSMQRKKACEEAGIPFEGATSMPKSVTGAAGGGMTLKAFVAHCTVDACAINEAMELIRKAGGIDQAKGLAQRWKGLVDAVGEEAAKKAVEFM